MPDSLYREHEYKIIRSDDGTTKESGRLSYWSDEPVTDYHINDTFAPIAGVSLRAKEITIGDSVVGVKNGVPIRQWKVTINSEGSGSQSGGGSGGASRNDKFTFDITEDGKGGVTKTGTWQSTSTGAAPTLSIAVGDSFTVPGVGAITCTKVSGSDGYSNGERFWSVTVEGSSKVSGVNGSHDKYTFDISKDKDGVTTKTATKETTCTGNVPTIVTNIGGTFNVPYIGAVKCTGISSSDEYNDSGVRVWTVKYEGTVGASGSGSDPGDDEDEDNNLPANKTEITHEINGITVRSVAGELLVLRRSSTPITRKSITIYNTSDAMLTTIGGAYVAGAAGITISEKITHETIEKSGVIVKEYYRHDIEVES